MRALTIVAVLALVGVTGLLFYEQGETQSREREDRIDEITPTEPRPERMPLPRFTSSLDRGPRGQQRLRDFVALCTSHGAAAVPVLLARLEEGTDVQVQPRWVFERGALVGYPTVRSAYIAALASIPGQEASAALAQVLGLTKSVEETYQIAVAMNDRGDEGWAAAALERATGKGTAATLPVQKSLVELAAREEPVATMNRIIAAAPRDGDATDPALLALGLRHLPVESATQASWQVLSDAAVTTLAKSRYVRALCNRRHVEPRVWQHLREVIAEAGWNNDLRMDAAYAAAGAEAFYLDEIEYRKAAANGDTGKARAIKARYSKRLVDVEGFVQLALGSETESASDARAASLRRMLERHRERVK